MRMHPMSHTSIILRLWSTPQRRSHSTHDHVHFICRLAFVHHCIFSHVHPRFHPLNRNLSPFYTPIFSPSSAPLFTPLSPAVSLTAPQIPQLSQLSRFLFFFVTIPKTPKIFHAPRIISQLSRPAAVFPKLPRFFLSSPGSQFHRLSAFFQQLPVVCSQFPRLSVPQILKRFFNSSQLSALSSAGSQFHSISSLSSPDSVVFSQFPIHSCLLSVLQTQLSSLSSPDSVLSFSRLSTKEYLIISKNAQREIVRSKC